MTKRRLVLIDIDGTLLPKPGSEARFGLWLLRRGRLGPRQLFAYLWFLLCNVRHYRSLVWKKNKAYLSGLEVPKVEVLAEIFVRRCLLAELNPAVLARLHHHRQTGDHVVLLSGTPQFIASALARELGVAAACGAVCASRYGRYTAAAPLRHPYGRTKVDVARTLAVRAGLPLQTAIAYGDSISDAWLFQAVGKAFVVRPDAPLRSLASDQGWGSRSG